MSDVAAAHRELIRLAACMAESSAIVLTSAGQITDDEDLKMLEWISTSIAALQELTGQGDATLLQDRPHRHAIRNFLNAIKGGALLLTEGAPDNGLDAAGPAARAAEEMVAHSDAILACLDEVKQGAGQA
ncbi:hypothetical protein SAE02_46250 [Skermanella aerolata]|uniref:Uncharacterized protein n=1 Tax=Skermanella aerolata TaxID=393310 RepID=A0A512DVJ1_9PROT|nr:hypothetical protein [Skermanella aerolata]KJB94978.1 hypothetical protein N826_08495 [Skermanella aerolata KACC 11604]GEO40477.1 hypothetical protein SAE02_46250 [Skermanella aerolata]